MCGGSARHVGKPVHSAQLTGSALDEGVACPDYVKKLAGAIRPWGLNKSFRAYKSLIM